MYAVIVVSFAVVFYKAFTKQIPWVVALPYALNLLFNFAFTPIHFGLKNNLLAFVSILLVVGTLLWAFAATWYIAPALRWVIYSNIPYFL